MRKLVALTVLALTLGGVIGETTAQAKAVKSVAVACPGVVQGVYYYRNATWGWQKQLGEKPTRSVFNASRVHSCKYARWVARQWMTRATVKRKAYKATFGRYEWANANIDNAISFAGPIFGVSTGRLHNRVSSEGRHGGWICNSQGSHACGWFQFMSGTYYSYSGTAFSASHVPLKYNSWYSPLGQALTAAYMFSKGLECTKVGWAASC